MAALLAIHIFMLLWLEKNLVKKFNQPIVSKMNTRLLLAQPMLQLLDSLLIQLSPAFLIFEKN